MRRTSGLPASGGVSVSGREPAAFGLWCSLDGGFGRSVLWDTRGRREMRIAARSSGRGHVSVHRHRGIDRAVGTVARHHGRCSRRTRSDGSTDRRRQRWLRLHHSRRQFLGGIQLSGRSVVDGGRDPARHREPVGGLDLRLRMGLHTGPASFRDGDYFGPSLNRSARLTAAAHGGQVLLSGSTTALVESARSLRASACSIWACTDFAT